ncbi:tyrosine-type recombinase/integrase [Lysobacter niastensis]|uniref:Site-specific integrase n=1 Tax=Lysobacter niastensis TaxID=380629 RepID=A0ABS0B752_9GAMM|nr:site-specific integrase [Lysobacter niastensis]MBF6024851.1 site-specific integrase [Lysobacter niastensis]
MARKPVNSRQSGVRISSAEARNRLHVRREPYWVELVPGTAIGYAKGVRDVSWFVRQRAAGAYRKQRIGTPDDGIKADGTIVLSYSQAVKLATTMQLEDRKPLPRHYSDGLTLNQVFDDYLEQRQVTPGGRFNRVMPKSTAQMSNQVWERHARKDIGSKLVTALDAKAMRKWHASMATVAPTVRGKTQDFDATDPERVRSRRATANRILTIAKAALTWARQHDALPDDMADWWRNVSPFALGDDPVPRMLDKDEIARLLGAAPTDLRTLLQGALMTGARYGELCTMRVRDFDAAHGTVTIRQSKTYKTLTQPLTPEGVALFQALTADRKKDDPIFVREGGAPWARSDAAKPMATAVLAAQLEEVTFKTTRATYGKLLLVATKDIELVAKALGHSDSRITRKHYAALLPSEVKAGIARLPALGF